MLIAGIGLGVNCPDLNPLLCEDNKENDSCTWTFAIFSWAETRHGREGYDFSLPCAATQHGVQVGDGEEN